MISVVSNNYLQINKDMESVDRKVIDLDNEVTHLKTANNEIADSIETISSVCEETAANIEMAEKVSHNNLDISKNIKVLSGNLYELSNCLKEASNSNE